jgi:hypothetical protein
MFSYCFTADHHLNGKLKKDDQLSLSIDLQSPILRRVTSGLRGGSASRGWHSFFITSSGIWWIKSKCVESVTGTLLPCILKRVEGHFY